MNLMHNITIRKNKRKLTSLLAIALAAILSTPTVFGLDGDEARRRAKQIEQAFKLKENQHSYFDAASGLEGYLAYAALNNPGLKAAFYRWKSALEKQGYAGALPDPKFTYGYFIENVETRVGPQEQRFSIRQSVPWFGTLGNRRDVAFEAANAVYQEYQVARLQLFYKVKAAYYDYWFLGRQIQLTRENMELLKFWESAARTRYKTARQKYHDLIKAQVELAKLEDELSTFRSMVQPVAARLRSALNLPDSIKLPVPDSIPYFADTIDRDSIVALATSANPDLQAIEHLIKKEKASVRLAGRKWLPDFTIGVDYITTGEAVNLLMEESGKDPWAVSVGINLPVWFGKNRSHQEEAKARYKTAQYTLDNARNRIIELTENVVFEYEDGLRKVRLYRDGLVPKAEQSLNASYTAYQAGEADFLNVLDAQRQLLHFQLVLDRARSDLAKRKAELEMLTGSEINPN